MPDLETLIDTYRHRTTGGKNPQPTILDELELATLIVEAKSASDVHPAVWSRFRKVLETNTDLDPKKEVPAVFKECRITADLGAYPYGVDEFVPLFLASRGYVMEFSGSFGNATDFDFIYNDMMKWSHEIIGGKPIYPKDLILGAFKNWRTKEKDRLLATAYRTVVYDPTADTTVLRRFAELLTSPTSGNSEKTARDIHATEIVLRNFIYRTKNHMRSRWYHGIHLMPVLFGPQGSGKTTAFRHLLSPIRDFASNVGFDVLEHDGKMYNLSVTPVMFFDELAGITKAEIERFKDIMHAESRELRPLYANPSMRTIVSTFAGCTNKDISTLIRDETGNRRFFQIETPRLERDDILAFDALAMWRSVDEDGEPPLYANKADLDAITDIQAEQRHLSPVEQWLEEYEGTQRPTQARDLFTEDYRDWLNRTYPGQERFWNIQNFGKELTRLIKADHPRLSFVNGKSAKMYRVEALDTGVSADVRAKVVALKGGR